MTPVWYKQAFFFPPNKNHDFSLHPVLYLTLPNTYTQFTTALLQNKLFQKQQNRLNSYRSVSFALVIPPLPFPATILLPSIRYHVLFLFKTYRARTYMLTGKLTMTKLSHGRILPAFPLVGTQSGSSGLRGHWLMNVYRFTNIKTFTAQTSD